MYNRLINSYEKECKAKGRMTLEEANKYWQYFVEEYYHQQAHSGIAEYYVKHELEGARRWNHASAGIHPGFCPASIHGCRCCRERFSPP